MARVTSWRSSLWARWLGWTAVFTVGLGVWGASLDWENNPLWVLGDGVGFLAVVLVPAALALAIGVCFADWWWVFGVLVAYVLLAAAFVIFAETGAAPERGSGQAGLLIVLLFFWFVHCLVVMLPAAATGVWWGQRRHATAPKSERLRVVMVSIVAGLGLLATVGYAVRELTPDEAQTRIAAGSGGTPDASVVHAVTGTVVIESSQHFGLEGSLPYHVGDRCHGDAGFDDIRAGAEVRALDGNGNIVGLGRLSTGVLTDGEPVRVCQFSWTMAVDDAELYAFKIAHWHGPSFRRAELEAVGWTVSLSI